MSVVPRQGDGKVTVPELLQRKSSAADSPSQKIVCLTAYDYPTSRLADEAGVDVILVGDSLGMVVLGYDSTLPVTLDEMLHHTRAVRRGTRRGLVVADMPYGSYHAGTDESLRNAVRFVKEAGADADRGNPKFAGDARGEIARYGLEDDSECARGFHGARVANQLFGGVSGLALDTESAECIE